MHGVPRRTSRSVRALLFGLALLGASNAWAADDPGLVSLPQETLFASPKDVGVVVPAGSYRLSFTEGDPFHLSLTPAAGGPATLLAAETGVHDETLTGPVALVSPDASGETHLVLMLPGGGLLEATGTRAAVAERGRGKLRLPKGRKFRLPKKRVGKLLRFKLRPDARAGAAEGAAPSPGPSPSRSQSVAGGLGPSGRFDPDVYYRLTTEWQGPGKSLDVANDGARDRPVLADTGNYSGPSWKITAIDDSGYYRLTTEWQGPGKSLDIANEGARDRPILADTGNYSGQSWKITAIDDSGYYRLTTEWQGPGKSLDILPEGDNDQPILADTGNYSGQSWKITPIGGGGGGGYVAACTWKTSDIIDRRIDIGAQYSLMRKMGRGPPTSNDASAMIGAIKSGALAGILLPFRTAPSERARLLGRSSGHALIPAGRYSTCVTEPAGQPPLIVYRTNLSDGAIDRALSEAWAECGLPTPEPPCDYVVDRHKPPPPPPPPPDDEKEEEKPEPPDCSDLPEEIQRIERQIRELEVELGEARKQDAFLKAALKEANRQYDECRIGGPNGCRVGWAIRVQSLEHEIEVNRARIGGLELKISQLKRQLSLKKFELDLCQKARAQ